jgi:hypothetical protein
MPEFIVALGIAAMNADARESSGEPRVRDPERQKF